MKSVFMLVGIVFPIMFTLVSCASVQFRRSSAVAPAFEQMAYGQGYLDGYAAAVEEAKARRQALKERKGGIKQGPPVFVAQTPGITDCSIRTFEGELRPCIVVPAKKPAQPSGYTLNGIAAFPCESACSKEVKK
jgi:hypothetical protein